LDMLRKLRMETLPSRAYDATMLLLAQASKTGTASLRLENVPEDLAPAQFFERLLAIAWERLPVSERATARELYGKQRLPTAEVKPSGATQLALVDDK
jgi:hypothetical protein